MSPVKEAKYDSKGIALELTHTGEYSLVLGRLKRAVQDFHQEQFPRQWSKDLEFNLGGNFYIGDSATVYISSHQAHQITNPVGRLVERWPNSYSVHAIGDNMTPKLRKKLFSKVIEELNKI